jgi:3-hydroxyisobutyrate dehydrogenase
MAEKVAFIGVGNMGLPMSERLLRAGHHVRVFDRLPERMAAANARGAEPAASARAAAADADIVHVCVMWGDDVERAVFGPDGVARAGRAGQLLIDHSTISVERAVAMAARLKSETGAGWIDAPVSGGPPGAAEGTLAIFVGGSDSDFARARPLLQPLGRRVTHMGPVGSGLKTKMINQIFVGSAFAVIAEAVSMAERSGLAVDKVPEALAGGYADSAIMQRFWPKMHARAYEPPAGYLFQMLKDMDLVAEAARACQAPLPMAMQATQLMRMLVARGHGKNDCAAMFRLFDEKSS